jgi:predicted DNA-binding transcriptional regulator AlpA
MIGGSRPTVAPAYLTDEQAAEFFGVSVRTLLALSKAAWFPRPVQLGPRLKRHVRAELESAAAKMPRQLEASEPMQLARARRARIERAKVDGCLG